LTDEEPRSSAIKAQSESSGQAAAGGGGNSPVGAIVGGICGVIGAVVIGVIVYVLLRMRRTGSYDPRSGVDGDQEKHEVEFADDNCEQTTLVTFHDETTISGAEQALFVADATETFGGDLASLMGV
jgi:hypothetical protein